MAPRALTKAERDLVLESLLADTHKRNQEAGGGIGYPLSKKNGDLTLVEIDAWLRGINGVRACKNSLTHGASLTRREVKKQMLEILDRAIRAGAAD